MLRLAFSVGLLGIAFAIPAPPAMQTAINAMRSADTQKAKPGQILLNFQSPQCAGQCDSSPAQLFQQVDPALFSYDVYQAYKALWPLMTPDVNAPETYGPKTGEVVKFLQLVQKTPVYAVFEKYMKGAGHLFGMPQYDLSLLANMWFHRYSRAADKTTNGSSGFEHVFVGEEKPGYCKGGCGCQGIVDGQHYWGRIYYEESQGKLNYYGDYSHQGPPNHTFQMTIEYMEDGKFVKKIGGGLVGTSVEFDFCLFTMAWYFNNNGHTEFTIDGHYQVAVVAYVEQRTRNLVATTYPIDNQSPPAKPNCPTQAPHTKGPTLPPSPTPTSLVQVPVSYLAAQDSAMYRTTIALSYQNMASRKFTDVDHLTNLRIYDHDQQNFYTTVSSSVLTSPIYQSLQAVLAIFNPDVSVAENWSAQDLGTIDAFLNAVVGSNSWVFLANFLRQHHYIDQSQSLKAHLKTLWFTQFSRNVAGGSPQSSGPLGSCAFETVFAGETYKGADGGPVNRTLGMRNWARVYALETTGALNYYGWIKRARSSSGSDIFADIQFAWNGNVEVETSYFQGSSIEFDLGVFTLCALVSPGQGCHFAWQGRTFGLNTVFASGLLTDAHPYV